MLSMMNIILMMTFINDDKIVEDDGEGDEDVDLEDTEFEEENLPVSTNATNDAETYSELPHEDH